MDDDDKTGLLGCIAALFGLGAAIGVVIFLVNMDWGPVMAVLAPDDPTQTTQTSGKTTRGSTGSNAPLTHVGPIAEKQVVNKALHMDPLARKIETGDQDQPIAETPEQPSGVVAVVPNLGTIAPPSNGIPMAAAQAVQHALKAETLCYKGTVARRMTSLFNGDGFAVGYGADDFNGGDPLPRLEIFYDFSTTPVTVTVMSMTHRDIDGFPNNHEVPIAYSSDDLSKTIARWMAAVATDTCQIDTQTDNTSQR